MDRELETSPSMSSQAVREVLGGLRRYDDVEGEEQAVVRVRWRDRMDRLRDALRLDLAFKAEGRGYIELDDDGNVIEHHPVSSGDREKVLVPGDDSAATQPSHRREPTVSLVQELRDLLREAPPDET